MEESSEHLTVRQDVAEPPQLSTDRGAMVTVIDKAGSATRPRATSRPRAFASGRPREAPGAAHRGRTVVDYGTIAMPRPKGRYESPLADDPSRLTRREKYEVLAGEARNCRIDGRIVDWEASLWTTRTRQAYFTADGGEVEQVFHYLVPNMSATAHADGVTQTRTHAGRGNGYCRRAVWRSSSPSAQGQRPSVAEGRWSCWPRPTARARSWTFSSCPTR